MPAKAGGEQEAWEDAAFAFSTFTELQPHKGQSTFGSQQGLPSSLVSGRGGSRFYLLCLSLGCLVSVAPFLPLPPGVFGGAAGVRDVSVPADGAAVRTRPCRRSRAPVVDATEAPRSQVKATALEQQELRAPTTRHKEGRSALHPAAHPGHPLRLSVPIPHRS